MSRKTFVMQIFVDDLEKRLCDSLKKGGEEHYKLVSKIIIRNLEVSEVGMQHLYLAFSGMEEKVKFFPEEEVLVHIKNLHNWSISIPDMETRGIIVNGIVKAKVKGTFLTRKDNVQIEYQRIRVAGAEPELYEQYIDPNYLNVTEECKITRPDVGDLI